MKRWKRLNLISITIVACLWTFLFWFLRSPVLGTFAALTPKPNVEAARLRSHVEYLSALKPARSFDNPETLASAEAYIVQQLQNLGYQTRLQDVVALGRTYHNIIANHGDAESKHLVVLGAHYDVAGSDRPGADDNASGVAGLLEIARLLKTHQSKLAAPVELVAYTLEEPPFFGGAEMGSFVHAQGLKDRGVTVDLMISLEMLGYYSDELFSQDFPMRVLYGFYPWRGNFIAVVGRPEDRQLVQNFKSSMAANSDVPVYSINAPSIVPGVDFSDHRNYWSHDWPAVMITDTAFLRNKQYHELGDTPDRLNFEKMAEVVRGVYGSLVSLAPK